MTSRTEYSTQTSKKSTLFSGQFLRNRSTLDIGVLGYIGIVWPKEHSPEVWSVPSVTPCIKSVLWRVAKCLSYTEEARCLKVKLCCANRIVTEISEIYLGWRCFIKTNFLVQNIMYIKSHTNYRSDEILHPLMPFPGSCLTVVHSLHISWDFI